MDGTNGNLKKNAHDDSIRMGYKNTILNAEGFKNWMTEKKYSTIPFVLTTEDIQKVLNDKVLKKRWDTALQIKGTQSYHDYRVDTADNRFLFVRHYTSSEEYKRVKIRK